MFCSTVPVGLRVSGLIGGRIISSAKISKDVAMSLEQLSLVDFSNEEAIKCLEDVISFADKLLCVNTDGVQPIILPEYLRCTYLRNDEVSENSKKKELMRIAAKTEEQYYVSPPGNISIRNSSEAFSAKKNKVVA